MLYQMSNVSGPQKIYFLAKLRFKSKAASKRQNITCKSRLRLVPPLHPVVGSETCSLNGGEGMESFSVVRVDNGRGSRLLSQTIEKDLFLCLRFLRYSVMGY